MELLFTNWRREEEQIWDWERDGKGKGKGDWDEASWPAQKRRRIDEHQEMPVRHQPSYHDTYYSRLPRPPTHPPPGHMEGPPPTHMAAQPPMRMAAPHHGQPVQQAGPSPEQPLLATYVDDFGTLYTGPAGLKLAAAPPMVTAPVYAYGPPQGNYVPAPGSYMPAQKVSYVPDPQAYHAPQKSAREADSSSAAAAPPGSRGRPQYPDDDDRYKGDVKGKGKAKSIYEEKDSGYWSTRAQQAEWQHESASSQATFQRTGWMNKCSELVTLVLREDHRKATDLAKYFANSSAMFPLLPSDVKNMLS